MREIGKNGKMLRIVVESGGCSGFQYKFELADNLDDSDMYVFLYFIFIG